MTYPGIEGQRGVFWINPKAFQVRQSTAGGYPGTPHYQSVVNSWGPYASAWAVTAANVTVVEEEQADPHPIEQDNFELSDAEGGTEQFGVDNAAPSTFQNNADPQEVDQGVVVKPNYTGE